MRVLIIKMSSMGDIIHTLPALTDAMSVIPGIQFDWAIEPSFSQIPSWHNGVKKIILTPFRQWRKKRLFNIFSRDLKSWYNNLQETHYDYVIDAQGLLKSAIVTKFAKGFKVGYSWSTARESVASLFYQRKLHISKQQHAINRTRQLFSRALSYALPNTEPNYGIKLNDSDKLSFKAFSYIVFLHSTSWQTKHWPIVYWQELARLCNSNSDIKILLPWGNDIEYARATSISSAVNNSFVLPKTTLAEMAKILSFARSVVAVDTGLGHLAAALNVPTISLYGPTNSAKTGTMGSSQIHLSADYKCSPCLRKNCLFKEQFPPCFATISPALVWGKLKDTIKK